METRLHVVGILRDNFKFNFVCEHGNRARKSKKCCTCIHNLTYPDACRMYLSISQFFLIYVLFMWLQFGLR